MHTLPRYLHQKTKVWNFSVEEKVSAQLSTHSERAVCGLSADTTLIISFGISILTPCFWRQTCLNLKELFLAGHNRFQEDEMSIILSLQSFWQDNPIVFSPCNLLYSSVHKLYCNLWIHSHHPCFLLYVSQSLCSVQSHYFPHRFFYNSPHYTIQELCKDCLYPHNLHQMKWSVVIFPVLDGER